MAHRVERIARVIREIVSDAITNRLSDPRICRMTSVTRVTVSGDLMFADVYVSVMDSEAVARKTLNGFDSARGMIQGLVARRLDTRRCPTLRFHLDLGIKKGFEIIRELDRLGAELRAREGTDAAPDVAKDEVSE